ncbi:hypothetical protein SAMN05421869_101315 [Nonomuraea jiangxiensis]|uniref:Polyketide cyclase / dehydrase and lipid transport n=2 Tax=Nonomuraea jiangxiensis TaxID=633440 RepID=A0A1G7Z591_9ACTN|nr:hypothetical protein SAMN05421869_101315 [Nonomuraea jiangxiensis]
MLVPRSLFRLAVGAAAGYLLAVRPWHLRWGASDSEVFGGMAGDDIVRTPQYQATRAITVDAPVASVWASLIRLGGYTPGTTTPRTTTTAWPGPTTQTPDPATAWPGPTTQTPDPTTAWPGATEQGSSEEGPGAAAQGEAAGQHGPKVGDVFPEAPDGSGFVVEEIDPPNALVLAQRGSDATTTCSIALHELDGGTRMVFRVRIRAEPGLRGTAYLASMDLSDFVAMRRQMLTIKSRAESGD